MMFAVGLKEPEVIITMDEAKRLASAIVELKRFYPMIPIDPLWIAWFQIITIAGAIYYPRVVRAMARRAHEKAHRTQPIAETLGMNTDQPNSGPVQFDNAA